jgi:hypothetical protein
MAARARKSAHAADIGDAVVLREVGEQLPPV